MNWVKRLERLLWFWVVDVGSVVVLWEFWRFVLGRR